MHFHVIKGRAKIDWSDILANFSSFFLQESTKWYLCCEIITVSFQDFNPRLIHIYSAYISSLACDKHTTSHLLFQHIMAALMASIKLFIDILDG